MTVEGLMERTVRKNLVKFAVQTQIFCHCGKILDCRKAILIELGFKGDERKSTVICCGKAHYAEIMAAVKKSAQSRGLTVDVESTMPNGTVETVEVS